MITLVSKIVFILSLLGILFIVFRKIPALSQLPEKSFVGKFSLQVISKWFSTNNFFRNILVDLEKSLRRFRIAAWKFDNIIDKLIRKIRRHSKIDKPS